MCMHAWPRGGEFFNMHTQLSENITFLGSYLRQMYINLIIYLNLFMVSGSLRDVHSV